MTTIQQIIHYLKTEIDHMENINANLITDYLSHSVRKATLKDIKKYIEDLIRSENQTKDMFK